MKIIVLSSYAPSLVNFRKELLNELLCLGHEVITIAPVYDDRTKDALLEMGVKPCVVSMQSAGLNPFSDIKLCFEYRKLFKQLKPDLILSYTIKPVIYGSIASRKLNGARVFSMITGIGSVFIGKSLKLRIANFIARHLYNWALSVNEKVFFQNPDDMNLFLNNKLVKTTQAALINGSGVNCDQFGVKPLPKKVSFTLIARIIRDKGVEDYVDAARIVKLKYPNIKFKLIGPFSNNPSAIKYKEVKSWSKEGVIEYLGKKSDVREELEKTSVFVLPSYREGTPRSVLEAMAVGRPIITTDVPGCRETVVDGENGFLVPLKNPQKLAEAMIYFIENPLKIATMGAKSREIVESKYDVNEVNKSILKELAL